MVDLVIQKTDKGTAVKCVHCEGTGVCKKSIFVERRKPEWHYFLFFQTEIVLGEYVARCDNCGDGLPSLGKYSDGKHEPPKYKDLHRPVCKICNGTGFVRI